MKAQRPTDWLTKPGHVTSVRFSFAIFGDFERYRDFLPNSTRRRRTERFGCSGMALRYKPIRGSKQAASQRKADTLSFYSDDDTLEECLIFYE